MKIHPHYLRDFFNFFIISSLLIFTPACSSKGKEEMRMPPVPIVVGSAIQKDIPVQINSIGTVESYSTVSVKSLVSGELIKVYFKEGDFVKKGELLFKIDPRPFKAALSQAEANLAKDIAIAKNAREQVKRYDSLLEKGFASKEDYDRIHSNADAQEAMVEADRALIENSRLQLEYCSIRSPIDGHTGSLIVHEGNIVKANDVIMVVIEQVNPIKVSFSVPEQYLPEIKKYMAKEKPKVEAVTSKEEENPEQGVLTFVDNTVDKTTGTILLKGTFENKSRRLWPGQFVNVTLTLTTEKNAVVVPSQAVQTGQTGQYIYVVKPDMTVESRPVRIGRTYKGNTIVEKGLAPGEKVVTDGQLRLVPGAKIIIKPPVEKLQ